MTLAVDMDDEYVVIEEKNKQKIRIEDQGRGVVFHTKERVGHKDYTAEGWCIQGCLKLGAEGFDTQLKDEVETLILNNTHNSHLMERGSVAQEAVNLLLRDTE